MAKQRVLKVTSAKINVSNIRSWDGRPFIALLEVKGILPGCRKVTTITVNPCYNSVSCRDLWSHHGQAYIHPSDWARLIRNAPVVSDKHFPLEITWEIEQTARQDALEFCECNAITDDTHVAPSYKATQRHDAIEFAFPRA